MEGLQGRHVRDALDALTSASAVYTATARVSPNPDTTRRLFEQLGTLYDRAQLADDYTTRSEQAEHGAAVQELAAFVDTVRRALRHPQGATAQALRLALHRYEHARNPRQEG
jgi:hypothetical protein